MTTKSPDATPLNRLADETSPYLLQHAHNPVDWWPWSPAALAYAQAQDRPILLSVGYAACHWCHVMAHESFEDPATAQLMNALFVNIKVDREERPDIDQIYMNALHALGEQGGWPLTMFLTPQGEPVWGGTYFPKDSRFGRAAFADVLHEVARLFREDRAAIDRNRSALMARLAERAAPAGQTVIDLGTLDRVSLSLVKAMDHTHGGLRGAPKFPQAAIFEMLWRAGARQNDSRFFDLVGLTLNRICEGGIYDHLAGGFARYSVDERWLVPHFEKMLYDNAQLLDLLALVHAHDVTPLWRQRAGETVAWLAREMTTAEGAFAASLDADSEGEEGKFAIWSAAEIRDVLGADDAAFFAAHYDVTDEGNFEGHTILNRLGDVPRSGADETRLAALRTALFAVREQRVRPGLDDKVLADWNGMMIAALVRAGLAFGEPGWIAMGRRAFDMIAREMSRDGRLGHSFRAGRLLFPGLSSDHALMIRAALALFEATGDAAMLTQALAWQRALDAHYANADNGGYFVTADDAEGLIVRPAATTDDAIPNANAIAADNLVRLATFTGDETWRTKADALLGGVLARGADNLFGHVATLNALDTRLRLAEITIVGPADRAAPLAEAALALPWLTRTVMRIADVNTLPPTHPARAKADVLAPGTAAAFVCVGETCALPVTLPAEIAATVSRMLPVARPA